MKEDEQKTFRKWLSDICTASTVSKYHIICNNIEKKVEQYKMEGWWHWWKVRRLHIVTALHGFGLPCMNLAEVGHSSMKRHRLMWLSQAVNDDCIHFLFQEANYNKFLNNSDKVRGKGPTQFDEIKMTEILRRNSYPWQLNLSAQVAFFMMKKNLQVQMFHLNRVVKLNIELLVI